MLLFILRRVQEYYDKGKKLHMCFVDLEKDVKRKSKVDPCGVCSLRVKANSVLCSVW